MDKLDPVKVLVSYFLASFSSFQSDTMVVTVRKDLFSSDKKQLDSKNIQWNSEKFSISSKINPLKRRALADITKHSNVPPKYIKLSKKESNVVDIPIKNSEGLERETNFANENEPERDPQHRIYSNNMKDAVKVICKICQKLCFLTTMRQHTRKMHMLTVEEYKKIFPLASI